MSLFSRALAWGPVVFLLALGSASGESWLQLAPERGRGDSLAGLRSDGSRLVAGGSTDWAGVAWQTAWLLGLDPATGAELWSRGWQLPDGLRVVDLVQSGSGWLLAFSPEPGAASQAGWIRTTSAGDLIGAWLLDEPLGPVLAAAAGGTAGPVWVARIGNDGPGDGNRLHLIRLGADGRPEFRLRLGPLPGLLEVGLDRREDGGVLVVASLLDNRADPPWTGFSASIDPSGGIDWQRRLSASHSFRPEHLQAVPGGGHLMASRDGHLLRVDPSGSITWQHQLWGW
jgi:hypothetical protein